MGKFFDWWRRMTKQTEVFAKDFGSPIMYSIPIRDDLGYTARIMLSVWDGLVGDGRKWEHPSPEKWDYVPTVNNGEVVLPFSIQLISQVPKNWLPSKFSLRVSSMGNMDVFCYADDPKLRRGYCGPEPEHFASRSKQIGVLGERMVLHGYAVYRPVRGPEYPDGVPIEEPKAWYELGPQVEIRTGLSEYSQREPKLQIHLIRSGDALRLVPYERIAAPESDDYVPIAPVQQ